MGEIRVTTTWLVTKPATKRCDASATSRRGARATPEIEASALERPVTSRHACTHRNHPISGALPS